MEIIFSRGNLQNNVWLYKSNQGKYPYIQYPHPFTAASDSCCMPSPHLKFKCLWARRKCFDDFGIAMRNSRRRGYSTYIAKQYSSSSPRFVFGSTIKCEAENGITLLIQTTIIIQYTTLIIIITLKPENRNVTILCVRPSTGDIYSF